MVRLVAPDATGERRVAEVALRSPIDWMQNGRAIVAADRDDAASPFALFTIDVADGRKHQVTSPAKGTLGDSQPRLSPDGSSLAFVRSAEASVQDVYTVSVNGGNPRRLTTENRAVEGLAWNAGEPELIASLERQGQARSLWRVFLSGASPLRIPDAGLARANGQGMSSQFLSPRRITFAMLGLCARQQKVTTFLVTNPVRKLLASS